MASEKKPTRVRAFVRAMQESTWASVALRAAGIVAALAVLAFIGRCGGGPTVARAADLEVSGDAGVLAPPAAAVPAPVPDPMPSATLAAPPVAALATPSRATPDTPVHLNHGDEADLRRLPGVGAKRAQAILALRTKLGRFQRIEDLLRVKGVGRGTLKKWRPLVTLDAPGTTMDAGAPSS